MYKILLTATALLAASTVVAQDGRECFSELTKYNVCEKARDMQRIVAGSLPMKMSANITLSMALVEGPRIVVIAIWHMTKSDLDATLRAGGMTLADLEARMNQATRNAVCGQEVMAAFIGLGGQMQYTYRTDDGYSVLAPAVTAC